MRNPTQSLTRAIATALTLSIVAGLGFHAPANAGVPVVLRSVYPASIASSMLKAIGRYFGKEGAGEASEYLARKGSKELLERVSTTATREGGKEAVEQVAKLTGKYGPETLAALDNVPNLMPVLRALDELPEAQVKAALAKLAAGQSGKELGEAVTRYGARALQSELKHPGVGLLLVQKLGDDGIELASKLSSNQAMTVARHADDIAKLPLSQKTGLMALLRTNTKELTSFIGRFVEANPGKTLFTAAATTLVLAEPDRILGGDEIVFDADGNPVVVTKGGLVGRTIDAGGDAAAHVSDRYILPLFYAALAFSAVFAACWMMIKLWHAHKREKLKTESINAPTIDANATSKLD